MKLLGLLLNELRGLLTVWLWLHLHPWPITAAVTALGGLALAWALVWRDLVKPELLAREHSRQLAEARA